MSKEYASSGPDPSFEAAKLQHYEEVDRAMNGNRPLLHEMPWQLISTTPESYALYSAYCTGEDGAVFMAQGQPFKKPLDVTDATILEFSKTEFAAFTDGVLNNEFNFGDKPQTPEQVVEQRKRLLATKRHLEINPTERRLTIAMDLYRQLGAGALLQNPEDQEPTQQ